MNVAAERGGAPARALVLAFIVACAMAGGVTRWAHQLHSDSARPVAEVLKALELDPSIGHVDGVLHVPNEGLQVSFAECAIPAAAFPIWVTSTAVPKDLDIYFSAAPFRSKDVYGGVAVDRFSRPYLIFADIASQISSAVRALFAKDFGSAGSVADKSFVRVYFARDCAIPDEKLIALGTSMTSHPFETR